MTVAQLSKQDLANMRFVLELKLEQHSELKEQLLATGWKPLIEDCTRRQRGSGLFWGAALIDGEWQGKDMLGRIWMDLRFSLHVPGTLQGKVVQIIFD